MVYYKIRGGRKLYGEVKISGAKNAAASILPGLLLINGICRICNVPQIEDVHLTIEILESLGAKVRWLSSDCIEADCREIGSRTVLPHLGVRMRASHFFIGTLLGRFGEANAPLPGGCVIGTRPIDQHLKGFAAMGADYAVDGEMVRVSVKNGQRLKGAEICFDMVTVGATMNLMLAAALADGVTVLKNAASEPHIVDLAGFLNAMGADVSGAGTDEIIIKGVPSLHGGSYSLIPDQIEAGTFMAAVAAAGGRIRLSGIIPAHLKCISAPLRHMGMEITEGEDSLMVSRPGELSGIDIVTRPYPGFPTDMQPQMGAVACFARGKSTIVETIWEDRLRYTSELRRMGADITVHERTAIFHGVPHLTGASVEALDLRAGAALVIAALAADGVTQISNIGFIERGYHDLTGKLAALGAEISREAEERDTEEDH